MKRKTWRKLKENKGMREENKMKNTNFKKDGRKGEDEKKKRKTRKRGEEIGRKRKRNQKLEVRRGKEAKRNKVQERCNATKSLFLHDDGSFERVKNFFTILELCFRLVLRSEAARRLRSMLLRRVSWN
jgi:hypothetical protein